MRRLLPKHVESHCLRWRSAPWPGIHRPRPLSAVIRVPVKLSPEVPVIVPGRSDPGGACAHPRVRLTTIVHDEFQMMTPKPAHVLLVAA